MLGTVVFHGVLCRGEIGAIVRPHKLNESRFGWSADDDVTQQGALR